MDVDVKETEQEFHVKADLPGMCKEDIKLGINNGILTISAERKAEVI